jgi:hypothetical protein
VDSLIVAAGPGRPAASIAMIVAVVALVGMRAVRLWIVTVGVAPLVVAKASM